MVPPDLSDPLQAMFFRDRYRPFQHELSNEGKLHRVFFHWFRLCRGQMSIALPINTVNKTGTPTKRHCQWTFGTCR